MTTARTAPATRIFVTSDGNDVDHLTLTAAPDSPAAQDAIDDLAAAYPDCRITVAYGTRVVQTIERNAPLGFVFR